MLSKKVFLLTELRLGILVLSAEVLYLVDSVIFLLLVWWLSWESSSIWPNLRDKVLFLSEYLRIFCCEWTDLALNLSRLTLSC